MAENLNRQLDSLQQSLSDAPSNWKDYLVYIRSKAEAGNSDAQGILSYLIQLNTTTGSLNEAIRYAKTSASKNSSYGQYALGRHYQQGEGVEQNATKADELFKRSFYQIERQAKSGISMAQYILGMIYECGRGVAKDSKEAINWFRKASEQGNEKASEALKGYGK